METVFENLVELSFREETDLRSIVEMEDVGVIELLSAELALEDRSELSLLHLPVEVLLAIFSKLSWPSILALGHCCRDLHRISNDGILWQQLFNSRAWYQLDSSSSQEDDSTGLSWKDRFRRMRKSAWKAMAFERSRTAQEIIQFLIEEGIGEPHLDFDREVQLWNKVEAQTEASAPSLSCDPFLRLAHYLFEHAFLELVLHLKALEKGSSKKDSSSPLALSAERLSSMGHGRFYAPKPAPFDPATLSKLVASSTELCDAFLSLLSPYLSGLEIERALSLMLCFIHPTSSTQLKSILQRFSHRYVEAASASTSLPALASIPTSSSNPSSSSGWRFPYFRSLIDFSSGSDNDTRTSQTSYPIPVFSTEANYMLCHCALLLNTDLHSGKIRKKMTLKEFLTHSAMIPTLKEVPQSYLADLYNRIAKRGLTIAGAAGPSACFSSWTKS